MKPAAGPTPNRWEGNTASLRGHRPAGGAGPGRGPGCWVQGHETREPAAGRRERGPGSSSWDCSGVTARGPTAWNFPASLPRHPPRGHPQTPQCLGTQAQHRAPGHFPLKGLQDLGAQRPRSSCLPREKERRPLNSPCCLGWAWGPSGVFPWAPRALISFV